MKHRHNARQARDRRRTVRSAARSVAGSTRRRMSQPVLKPLTKRLKGRGKPHKLIIAAVARSLGTIANAVLKNHAMADPPVD
ncbi:hypothetical protein [Paracoccus alcaliphilus]|uniref:hypothetical protein n=1 Tax=Paracoccus alcaliphilus TaxID=34002 RepID=UPI001B8BA46D|nr:hypothetical protein [Paracoccus alcaliphilus]